MSSDFGRKFIRFIIGLIFLSILIGGIWLLYDHSRDSYLRKTILNKPEIAHKYGLEYIDILPDAKDRLKQYVILAQKGKSKEIRRKAHSLAYKCTKVNQDLLYLFLVKLPDGPKTGEAEERLFKIYEHKRDLGIEKYLMAFPFKWYRDQATNAKRKAAQKRFLQKAEVAVKSRRLFWKNKYINEFPNADDVVKLKLMVDDEKDKLAWDKVQQGWKGTEYLKDYLQYLKVCPNGKHVQEVEKAFLDRGFSKLSKSNPCPWLEAYLNSFPKGKDRERVLFRLAQLLDTVESYDSYIKEFPYGPNVKNAKNSKRDLLAWRSAKKIGTKVAYREYLKKFTPKAKRFSEACYLLTSDIIPKLINVNFIKYGFADMTEAAMNSEAWQIYVICSSESTLKSYPVTDFIFKSIKKTRLLHKEKIEGEYRVITSVPFTSIVYELTYIWGEGPSKRKIINFNKRSSGSRMIGEPALIFLKTRKLDSDLAIPILSQALSSPNEQVREAAIIALKRKGVKIQKK